MDLRSFTKERAGCIFEIRELLNNVPCEQIVFVVDRTTSKEFFEHPVEEVCGQLTPSSTNFGMAAAHLRLYELQSMASGEVELLIRRLCGAAAPSAEPNDTASFSAGSSLV